MGLGMAGIGLGRAPLDFQCQSINVQIVPYSKCKENVIDQPLNAFKMIVQYNLLA